jgi:membrane-associated protease RseP (regulator of RpoE activity)
VDRPELLRAGGLFLVTFVSVCLLSTEGVVWGGDWPDALAFASTLMGILLAHELGHWFVARRHGFALSLPYFLPFPSLFGTMGAVIRLRSAPRSRDALLEMAVAGPIAGALVAFAALAMALPWTRGTYVPLPGSTYLVFADPLVVKVLGTAILGAPPDRMAELHPVALAAWCGCMLTGINLLPLGQLDGGHVINALWPGRARAWTWVGIALLALGGMLWAGWWVWAALLLFSGAREPLEVPAEPPPGARARLLAALALALFAMTFMPVPLVQETAP